MLVLFDMLARAGAWLDAACVARRLASRPRHSLSHPPLCLCQTCLSACAPAHSQERGTILTVFIVCYALTSFVGGYVSGRLYAHMEGRAWMQAMLLAAGLFPGLVFGIAFVLNTIAIGYHSLAAVPFGYIVIVLLLWAFLSFPLCIVGTVLGRNWGGAANNPCRVKRIPSPIPARAWYLSPGAIVAAGGLLPFGSIFIEMYFIFTSFWNYKVNDGRRGRPARWRAVMRSG